METKTTQRINETKRWYFEKINKIDKTLAKLTKSKRRKTQINKTKDERRDIITDNNEIQRSISKFRKLLLQYTGKSRRNG
jgi:hypothetical protein